MLFRTYVWNRQSIAQLAKQEHRSHVWIKKHLDAVESIRTPVLRSVMKNFVNELNRAVSQNAHQNKQILYIISRSVASCQFSSIL